jgi:hypothetical protein
VGNYTQNGSSIATIIAAIVAIIAFYYGYKQFYETQQSARESQAVELYVKYNELMKDAPSRDQSSSFWRDNLGVGIAESIFLLRRGDKGWERTAR